MSKLHELLAVLQDRSKASVAIHDETIVTFTKKPDHFLAHHTMYKPFDEASQEGEESSKEMVTTVHDKLKHALSIIGKSFDLDATRDATNQQALSTIILDGAQLGPPLAATTLLSLESRLKKLLALFMEIPTLAPGRKWELDETKGSHIYRDATPDAKFKTKKVPHHSILVPPTDKHPAQVREWTEDEKVGVTTQTVWSGMMSPAQKSQVISRTQDLIAAVKEARQRANMQEVVQVSVADILFSNILA